MSWIRSALRRLGRSPSDALAVVVLVAVTAVVFAATPRVLDTLADSALRDQIRAAPPQSANIELNEVTRLEPGSDGALAVVDRRADTLVGQLPAELRAVITKQRIVVDSMRWKVNSSLAEPTTVTMRIEPGIGDRIEYVDGRAPTGATRQIPVGTSEGQGSGTTDTPTDTPIETVGNTSKTITIFEAAVSSATARVLEAKVGDRLDLALDTSDQLVGAAGASAGPAAIEISGIFEPLDPADPAWYGEPGLLAASIRTYGPSFAINDVRVLLDPDAYPALMTLTGPSRTPMGYRTPMRYRVREFVDPGLLSNRGLDGLAAAMQRTESTFPKSATVARNADTAQLATALGSLLRGFRDRWSAAMIVMASGATGPAAMAIAALALVALLGARGRRTVAGRWRIRGASTIQVLRATFAEGLLVTGPAALVGTALAVGLVAGGPLAASLVAGTIVLAAGVILVGSLEIPPALLPRRGGRGGDADDQPDSGPVAGRSERRRVAVEALVVVLAVAAIALLRFRSQDAGGGSGASVGSATANPLLIAAPMLGGVAAAIIAHRLIPLPLRLMAALAAGRRDLTAVLAMRRASRQGGTTSVVMVLLAMTAITVFSASALLSLDHGADLVAWQQVGADYRIADATSPLPARLDVAAVPGITASSSAFRGTASLNADLSANELLAIDGPGYTALVRGTPADPSLPPEMLGPVPASLPVIVSALAARRAGLANVGDTFELRIRDTRLAAHVAAIRDAFPSLTVGGAFVVVAAGQVSMLRPDLALPATDLFLAGPPSARDALLATLSRLGPGVQLESRDVVVRSLREQPVTRAVVTVVAAAVVMSGVFALLALVTSLMLAGAARSIEVAHLRILGLRRRDASTLLVYEYGPVLGLALLAGALAGLGLFALLGGSLGLGHLLGSSLDIPPAADPVTLALVVGAIIAVTGVAIGLATMLQNRAPAAGALRRGLE